MDVGVRFAHDRAQSSIQEMTLNVTSQQIGEVRKIPLNKDFRTQQSKG